MGDDVVSRPEYELHMRAGLAEAANLLAAEAAAQQVAIERPFNGLRMRARPGATGAQVVVDWYYDLGCARETRQRQERDTLRARAEASEQRAEALAAELAQARADARVLVGMVNHACLWGLTQEDHDALEPLVRAADGLLDDEAAGVVRRALGGAA